MNYLQKELYQQIKEDSRIFDFIQNSSLNGLWYWDLENPEEEWTNAAFWKTLGYDPEEMPHKASSWQKICFEEDLPEVTKALMVHLKNPEIGFEKEIRFHHKKGHTVWLLCSGMALQHENGVPSRMLGAVNDISRFKKKEDELNKMREMLKNSNEAARIGTWDVDPVNSKIIWSDMTKIIHEVPMDYEPDLKTAINFYKEGESRENITRAVTTSMENGVGFNLDLQIITAQGNERWIRAIGLTEMKDSVCIRNYGTFQDIHDKKTAELKLEAMLDVSNDQNERLLNFAHIVSHNLRSHSSNLSMNINFLQQEKEEKGKKELLDMLKISSDNLEDTIQHLSSVVAINTEIHHDLESVNLAWSINAALGNVAALLKMEAGDVHNDVPEDLEVSVIPAYLDSILLNLIGNAIKYKHQKRDLVLKLRAENIKGKIHLWIEDNGRGIDLKLHGKKIFGMYKTFHGNTDAKGIGLFISKNQIEAMGGKISVESEVGKGSVFEIELKSAL